MKTFKNAIENIKSDERGVALIFTLGILALLLVLALSFASSSMLERKAALYSNNASSARMIAQAGLNRSIAAMSMYMTLSDNFDIIKSMETTGDNARTYDFLYRLNTDTDGVTYDIDMDNYDATDNGAVHWNYIYNGMTGTSKKIIGRFAYVILPAGGRLDPSACVDTGKNESSSVSTGSSDYEPRVGKEIYEIYIGGLEQPMGTYLTTGEVGKTSYVSDGGQLPDGGAPWTDYSAFFTAMGIGSTGTDIIKKMKWQDEWFAIGTADAPQYDQKYWTDTDNDGKIDTGETYHRFNIARTDWNTGFGTTANSENAVNLLLGGTATPNDFSLSFNNDSGVEWLKNYSSLPIKTFPDAQTRAKQIAANIIDYCDSDDIVTSDVSAAWTTSTSPGPTFIGLEETPYLNEIGAEIIASLSVGAKQAGADLTMGTADDYYTYTFDIDLQVTGEQINMYGATFGNGATVEIAGSYTVRASAGSAYDQTYTNTFALTATLSSIGSDTYKMSWSDVATQSIVSSHAVDVLASEGSVGAVEDVEISLTKAVFKYNGNNVNFVSLSKSPTGGSALFTGIGGAGASITKHYLVSCEVDDPRVSLHDADWPASGFQQAVGDNESAYPGTLQAVNSVVSYATSGDAESSSTPTSLSTAYIRNSVMKSPWEIGAIHRGAKWETINLQKYNTAGTASLGIGNYSDGDANILDQIKMTNDTKTYGLVNIKTSNEDVLRALFMGIYVDADYANVDANSPSGTVISSTNANSLAAVVKSYIVNNSPKNRAEIVNAAGFDDGAILSSQTKDAQKEALIGKMVNLTRIAKADIFKIIVLAQSINDTGGPYGTNVKIKKDLNFDKDTTDTISASDVSALEKIGYRNPVESENFSTYPSVTEETDCQKGKFEAGFDEIVGEQKIVATVKYDSTNSKWVTLKYELISE
jgi:hypothetical protein